MKNTITEMKNTLEGIHSRLSDSEQLVSWKTKQWKSLSLNRKKKKKRMKRNKYNLRDISDNRKHTNIHILGGPRIKRTKGLKKNICRYSS